MQFPQEAALPVVAMQRRASRRPECAAALLRANCSGRRRRVSPSRSPWAGAPRAARCAALHAERPPASRRRSASHSPSPTGRTVRHMVLDQLLRVEDAGAYAALASGAPGEDSSSSARERRDVTRLVSEVLRSKRRLDYIVDTIQDSYVRTKGGPRRKRAWSSEVRQILRLGTYELLELKKPNYVVDSFVSLAKDRREASWRG